MASTRLRPDLRLITLATFAAYLFVLRPRQLRWGATDEEVARAMPPGTCC
jgi:hypothetical protein